MIQYLINKYSHVNIGTYFKKDTWPNDFMKLEFELRNDTQGAAFYNQGLVLSSRKRRCVIAIKRSVFTLSSLRHKTQVQTCSMCAVGLLKPLLVMFTETGWQYITQILCRICLNHIKSFLKPNKIHAIKFSQIGIFLLSPCTTLQYRNASDIVIMLLKMTGKPKAWFFEKREVPFYYQ